jgi:UDP-N-acetyl-D-mannosaminuronic acid dehydrogenase
MEQLNQYPENPALAGPGYISALDHLSQPFEKVCVIGLGYIGLPTASLLATKGFKVHGVDNNGKVIKAIKGGQTLIYEPDLDILVKSAVHSGNLIAALEPEAAEVFILAVPTPFTDGHVPDISYVEAATRALAPYLSPGNLVILESTSPVGTTEKIADWLREMRPDLLIPQRKSYVPPGINQEGKIFLAHCPERVLPGQILRELIDNDRIIGGLDRASGEKARSFYQKFVKGNIFLTDCRVAELCKLVENAFRDVNIAFANELSLICDKLDVNVWELIKMANRHPRVNVLQPGPGVGGHCIAVDPWFIVHSAPQEAKLIAAARQVNDSKPHYVLTKIREKLGRFKDPVISCLGLSYKPDIDDLRESPALEIVRCLAEAHPGRILVVEPHIRVLPQELARFSNIEFTHLEVALKEADILVALVNHRAFHDLDRELLKEKIVIDTGGLWR